jgi:antitoxin (DNA-binding transcriptional repressor) of toxin-antitoxin stability system
MHAARSSDQQPARTIGVGELKERADEIVREVHETGRPIDVALGGEIVARLSPSLPDEPDATEDRRQAMREWLQETEAFAQEVARRWPSSVSAVELIREQRRER